MSDIAIKVENLSKLYQLGEVGTGTISHDLNRWLARIRGKEDPYIKIGQTNDRSKKSDSDFVWALNDINFEVKQGDVLGIIGRNGAGKSTLLKILSKITTATKGKVYTKGRIASLLEVGTGFHPEMTGRENIYLNGAILGMRKWEIDQKFDEIVDFAGVEAYIDTPVKRYSSGMYVRLAFAVAAYLEPEILIIDEILAVGDTEFQKKCLSRMRDVSLNEGRTILFVSHNLPSLKNLCNRSLLLDKGRINSIDTTSNVIKEYLNSFNNNSALISGNMKHENRAFEITDIKIDIFYNKNHLLNNLNIISHLFFFTSNRINNCYVNFIIENEMGDILIHQRTDFSETINPNFDIGKNNIVVEISNLNLNAGMYFYWFRIFSENNVNDILIDSEKIPIEIVGKSTGGIINCGSIWKFNSLS